VTSYPQTQWLSTDLVISGCRRNPLGARVAAHPPDRSSGASDRGARRQPRAARDGDPRAASSQSSGLALLHEVDRLRGGRETRRGTGHDGCAHAGRSGHQPQEDARGMGAGRRPAPTTMRQGRRQRRHRAVARRRRLRIGPGPAGRGRRDGGIDLGDGRAAGAGGSGSAVTHPTTRAVRTRRHPGGRLDGAYLREKVALEFDGADPHGLPEAVFRDRWRQNGLPELGWTVLRFTWWDVMRDPDGVADIVRRTLRRRAS